MLTGHGDDGYRFGKAVTDFSSNVYYCGEPAGLKEHIFNNWHKINRYPEVAAESLTSQIAHHHTLKADEILVTNGSTESIYIIAQLFQGKTTTILTPSFAEYEDACTIFNHRIIYKERDSFNTEAKTDTQVIFICNPNNPTGKVMYNLQQLINNNPQTLFVIDEAFIEFTFEIKTIIDLVKIYDNLLVLRSLTKAYAIPGLRLGYIAANAGIIEQLLQIKQPWSVNALALVAGNFIFDNYDSIKLPLESILKCKADFVEKVSRLQIKTVKSFTHFFLAKTTKGTAAELKKFLLDNFDLLIRDAGNFRGLTNQHFRVATLRPQENDLLINALAVWKDL